MFRAHFVKGLAAFGVGFVIVLLFALHPSVNAYHTGLSGWIVSSIFLAVVIVGATTKRIYILSALLFLAFAEPEVKITNSLQFNIVSDGLLIGAGATWLLDKPRLATSSIPILAGIGGMAVMTIVFPAAIGSVEWIHIHDVLMFGKYGLVAVLAFSLINQRFWWIAGALASGSLAVAVVSIAQAFHMPWFDRWMYEVYFASRNIPAEEVVRLSEGYFRSFGVAGPVGSALLLIMSLGMWFVLVVRSRTKAQVAMSSLGMNVILLAMYLTGSRLGIVVAVPVMALGVVWWQGAGSQRRQAWGYSVAAVFVFLVALGSIALNDSFRQAAATSTTRYVTTIPNLLRGTPDPSIAQRLAEFAGVDLRSLVMTGERDTGSTSEYVVLLKRYGLAGFLLAWQIWLMITVRAARAATRAESARERNAGMLALVVGITLIIGAIGAGSFFDPTRMTVLLILVGLTPALGPNTVSLPVRSRTERVRELAT
ncbi:MAG: hypothetical protein IH960_03290 [Chloroflexi bacterium]|nr:hypothetical protein [Chloroflexota bacterium]